MAKKRGRRRTPLAQVFCWNYLNYKRKKRDSKVARNYLEYRKQNGIPYRCDIEKCSYNKPDSNAFQNGVPMWSSKPLTLTVDHINGIPWDNTLGNLRLVCPNCASQLPTEKGKNKDRVISANEISFTSRNEIGGRDVKIFVAPLTLTVDAPPAKVRATGSAEQG